MTSAPKKKRDFFNGSQGLNLMDFRRPESVDSQEKNLGPENHLPRTTCAFPSSQSSQNFTRHSSVNYSPLYYSQDRCLTSELSLQTKRLALNDSSPLSDGTTPYASSSTPEQHSWVDPTKAASSNQDDRSKHGKKEGKKRKQRCRLCAKHNKYEEIKGHKYACQYRNPLHNCELCDITRKRRYFMAKEQQITRKLMQQEQLHMQNQPTDEARMEGYLQASLSSSGSHEHIDFPRMRELQEDTENILDEKLFRDLNERIRPRINHH